MQVKKNGLVRVLALAMAVCCLLPAMPASAERQTLTISDNFDNASIIGGYDMEVWSAISSSDQVFVAQQLTDPDKVLQFRGQGANGENTVLISKEWYWEVHCLSFDMKVPTTGSWFGLDFPDILEPIEYLGDNKDLGKPMCYGSYKASASDDFGFADTDWTYWGFGSKSVAGQWVSVKIVPKNEKTATLYMAPKGQAFNTGKGKEITLSEGRSFHNCNIVFTDYAFSGYMLDNIVIETDTGTYTEDFDDESDDLFDLITFVSNAQNFSTQVVEDGAVRSMCISNAVQSDRLITNDEIEQEDENLKDDEQVLSASFQLDMSGAQPEQELAYVFGLETKQTDPFVNTWAFVMNRESGRLVHFEEDGTETVIARSNFRSRMEGSTISLSVKKDGSFTVAENGRQLLSGTGVTKYSGYTGFAAKTDITSAMYLDDVVITNGIYHVITTKSYSDDFSENRLSTDGNSDHYYKQVSGSVNVSGGELVYSGCLDGTIFGPAYEYETFELTFELTSILGTVDENDKQNATYLNNWLGIDFGRKSVNTSGYGSYGMFLIRVRPSSVEEEWETTSCTLYKKENVSPLKSAEMIQVEPIPASYFKDITYDEQAVQREDISPDAAVCFKLVATKDQMELYMKRADQEEYTLYNILKGAEPYGYLGITCTGWTYWTVDNFAIKNTAEIYNEAPEVIIEEPELVSYEERGLGIEDTGWDEEVAINASYVPGPAPVNWVLIGIVVAAVVLAAVIAVAVVLSKRKKKEAGEVK